MWSIFYILSSFFWNSLLDFIFFVIIDAFAKLTLGDSRSHEEKRLIWFGESVVLAITCFIIYLCDHTPFLLVGLTLITFIYTQLGAYIDFRVWWVTIKTRWEEYQQHQESLSKMKEQTMHQQFQQQQQMAIRQSISMRLMQRKRQEMYQQTNFPHHMQQSQANLSHMNQHPSVFTQVNEAAVPTTATDSRGSKLYTSIWSKVPKFNLNLGKIFKGSETEQDELQKSPLKRQEYSFVPPNSQVSVASNQPYMQSRPLFSAGTSSTREQTPVRNSTFRESLVRRPIRQGNKAPFSSLPSPKIRDGYSIKNRFLSTFGFSNEKDVPPGLRNEGHNLCFMNSILQCLARSPNLLQHLALESGRDTECSVAESLLLKTLLEILETCKVKHGDRSVVDPTAFRQSAASLPNSIVAGPTNRQSQQDSAEFFMWLMDTVHNILNKNRKGHVQESLRSSERLKTLQFIYGDLTPGKIQDLKKACKQEIDVAHGLQNNSYAEAVQRLSDLEWLSYKKENDSVIDNLFTGQLVIGYHCLTDNRMVVNMQSFNILPVPIVSPREVSGLVILADCFTKFCNIEHLTGQEGLDHNSWCPGAVLGASEMHIPSPSPVVKSPMAYATPKLNGRRFPSSVDSAVGGIHSPAPFMSPIPGNGEIFNDSGFQDNVFKTSTPIGEGSRQQSFVPPQQQLRDAQRRCLLRQLPECLVIQLMRFSYNPFTRCPTKLLAPVSIPIKDLDLTQIMFDTVTNREDLSASENSYKYDLYGVCVHLGADSTSFGHYISYCLQPENNTWYRFDDEHVTEVNMEYELTTQELRENAYILFYKSSKLQK